MKISVGKKLNKYGSFPFFSLDTGNRSEAPLKLPSKIWKKMVSVGLLLIEPSEAWHAWGTSESQSLRLLAFGPGAGAKWVFDIS